MSPDNPYYKLISKMQFSKIIIVVYLIETNTAS
jgi:hypothetical protein